MINTLSKILVAIIISLGFMAITSYSQDFEVLRGTTTMSNGNTTVTITEGTDYTLPSGGDSTNCFIRLNNARHTGMGDTVGGGSKNLENWTTYISNPDNIATSITFTRDGTTDPHRMTWEILCYIGPVDGPNEFIVREVGVNSGTNISSITEPVSGVLDDADVLVMVTGQQLDAGTTRTDWHGALWTSDWDSINDEAEFSRLGGTPSTPGNMNVSYSVIEWTGSNWTLDRFETLTEGTAWSTANDNSFTVAHGITIPDINKAFIVESQYATNNDTTGLDDSGDAVCLESSNLRIYNRNTTNTRRKVVWILQNSQSGTDEMNVQHLFVSDNTTSGSEERTFTDTITSVFDIDQTGVFGFSASIDGGGTAYPRGSIDIRLTATNTVTFTETDNGQERRMCYNVVEFPTAPAADTSYNAIIISKEKP